MESIIDLQSDAYFMSEALRMAARAYEAEEVPIGAVIVREGRIIARAFNQVELLKDATAHAEMLALTQAEAAVGDWRLTDCDLYVTKEPCPMCAGAALAARLDAVIFGAADQKAGAMGSLYNAKWYGSPLLVTAGQQEQGHGLMEPVLYGPLVQMAEPLVKWAVEVTRLEDLPRIVRRAAKIADQPEQHAAKLRLGRQ